MNSGFSKIASALGVLFLIALLLWSPWESESSGVTDMLRNWGDTQAEISDHMTQRAVSGVEGTVVGEHQVNGANWSIPNILRSLFDVS